MGSLLHETRTIVVSSYDFSGGTLRELMDLAGIERRSTGRVNCKCCGRMMMPSQQTFETLYTCSPTCFSAVHRLVLQDDEYLRDESTRSAQSWD